MDAKIGPNVNFKHMFFVLNRPVWFQIQVNSLMKLGSDFLRGSYDWYSSWGIFLDYSCNEVNRRIEKVFSKAWDSSVNIAHSKEWSELGSCPADCKIWKFQNWTEQ